MDPPAILPATLDREEVTVLPSPIVPANGQEATENPPANHKEATAQLPPIVPEPPQIGELSLKGTMPTLVPLPASGIIPAENPHRPE